MRVTRLIPLSLGLLQENLPYCSLYTTQTVWSLQPRKGVFRYQNLLPLIFFFSLECCLLQFWYKHMGPVVQSVVCSTSSLRVISLTILADSIYNILIFFADKM